MASPLFILAAKRTPFGAFGGKLKGFSATDLAVHAGRAALAASGVPPAAVGASVWGSVAQTSSDAAYLARHAGLRCGLEKESTALTVNRLCGSGFQALVSAAHELRAGENATGLALIGGAESMSQAPLSAWGHTVRFGTKLGADLALQDTLWAALTDSLAKTPMGTTAEVLGAQYGVTRAECDAYALRSQAAWGAAAKGALLPASIAPMELPGRKGPEAFAVDEHPRPDTAADALARLPSVFKKEGGLVSAGNASGICDGAAALVLGTGEAAARHGARPLARVVGWATAGVDPKVMGIGPAPAVRAALARTGLQLKDMDLIEVRARGGARPRPRTLLCATNPHSPSTRRARALTPHALPPLHRPLRAGK